MQRVSDCSSCIWNKHSECGRDFCIFPACVASKSKKGNTESPKAVVQRKI
ncbi:MAG: hypothetical protein IJF27_02555 [Oscillospiraceae bacterium]|nr:hypothetical protein [Oscillospiraceae bacterium]MBQ3048857.1 hypothetical protein [Oscillospiraceae bacterium]MBQ9938426.1 hypothetical protein [Oscillospiraceae bacterium]